MAGRLISSLAVLGGSWCVNVPDGIFVGRHAGVSGCHPEVFRDDDHVVRTRTKILDDAAGSHRKLDAAEGLQDAQLDRCSTYVLLLWPDHQ